MYCKQCGHELDDDARFCTACGASADAIADETTDAANQPSEKYASSTAAEPILMESAASSEDSTSFSAMMDETKARSKSRIPRTVLIAVIVVVLAAGVAFAAYYISQQQPVANDISEETVMADFEEYKTDFLATGIMQSNYVHDSKYELTTLSIDQQKDEPVPDQNSDDTHRRVDFTAKMRNESFETEFNGYVYYISDVEDSSYWQIEFLSNGESSFVVDEDSAETIPISGVDEFSETVSSTNSTDATYSESDFSSTFPDPVNGIYTSTATAISKDEFWYATDTADKTQQFTFDPESGWKPDGDPEPSNARTSWDALIGMTFDMEYNGYVGLTGSADAEASLTFVKSDENNVITAHYTIAYNPTERDSDGVYGTLTPVNIEGDASCSYNTAQHSSSAIYDTFEFTLVDEAQNVEFKCSKRADEYLSGGMKLHAMLVDITTDRIYYRQGSDESGFTNPFKLTDAYFIENSSS